jgi:Mg/Co/Ni transporter MgtE
LRCQALPGVEWLRLLIELDKLFSQGLVAETAGRVGITLPLEDGQLTIDPATTSDPLIH